MHPESVTISCVKAMYLCVSPTDSVALHPSSNNDSFVFELPTPLYLDGMWSCGLAQVGFDKSQIKEVYIYCDLVGSSVVHGKLAPLLRICKKSVSFSEPFYLPITRNIIERIRFTLKQKDDSPFGVKGDYFFILHFKRDC